MPAPTFTTGITGLDTAIAATGYRASLGTFDVSALVGKIQHRHDATNNRQAVRRYVAMYKAGSVPPPIGVTRDGHVVWGNHRIEGAEIAGVDTLPAVIIEVDGDNADDHVRDQLLSLAVAENAPHGVPYSNQDRTERAATLLNLGYSNAKIQSILGLTAAQVSGIKREVEAELRLVAAGLDPKDFTRSTLRSFAGPDARSLNDDPFKELVKLAKEANLTSTEINGMARDAKAAGSDAAALMGLSDVRADAGMSQRIAEVAAGGTTRPTPVGKLRGALRGVVGLCDASIVPATYRDHTAGAADTVTMLDEAISCLQGIRNAQDPAVLSAVDTAAASS